MAGVTAASIHAVDPGVKLPLDVCFKQSDEIYLLLIYLYNIWLHGQRHAPPELVAESVTGDQLNWYQHMIYLSYKTKKQHKF